MSQGATVSNSSTAASQDDGARREISEEDLERLMGMEQQLKEKRLLESRLKELHDKKDQMDQLVSHLQNLRDLTLNLNAVENDSLENDALADLEGELFMKRDTRS